MDNYIAKSHDLFMLMITLSQVKNRDRMIDLFVDAINSLWPDHEIRFSKRRSRKYVSIELSSLENKYGYIVDNSRLVSNEEIPGLLLNACEMLTVFLEKKTLQEKLEAERDTMELRVQEKIQEFKASQKTYKDLYENVPLAIYRSEPGGKLISMNPAMPEIYGFRNIREMMKRPAQDYYANPEDREKLLALLKEKGVVKNYISKEVKKDGSFIWVKSDYKALKNNKGEIIYIDGISEDITEKRLAEAALERNMERLETAIESTGIGLWEGDLISGVVFRSENWYKMLGFNSEDIPDDINQWLDLIHPDDVEKVEEARLRHEEGHEEVFKVEHRLKTRDGGWKWVLNWGKITHWQKNGKPHKIVGVHIDIDEQKNRQLEVARLRQDLSLVINSLDDLFVYYDKDLKVKMINQATEEFVQKQSHECIGKDCFLIWQNNQKKHCKNCHVRKSLELLKPVEKISFSNDRYIRYKAIPVLDDEENVVGIAEFGQDITMVKKAENALKESEEKYRKLTETAQDIICIHDLNGKIKYLNSSGLEFVGLDKKAALQRNLLDFIPDDSKDALFERQQKRLKKNRDIFIYESCFIDKAGRHVPVEVSSSAIENKENNFDILILARDITDRKKAEKKLMAYSVELEKKVANRTRKLEKQTAEMERSQKALTFLLEDVNESREEMISMNKKLADANKELEAFSYSVSHDLKAPLRALDGFSQILLEDYEDKLDEDAHRYLHLIRENSQRMGLLIQDLLDFSRVGRYEVKIQDVDMHLMVEEVKNDVLETFDAENIECKINDLPTIKTDRTMIRQVWQNLISNAVKFGQNRDQLRIEIGAKLADGKIRYFVKDNGVGFDMKYKSKLFNVFQRLHTQEEFEGTGVGLAIVKRIIKRLGGEVDAWGEKDQGAKFLFELPIREID